MNLRIAIADCPLGAVQQTRLKSGTSARRVTVSQYPRVPASSSRTARRGFSFTEILFAVMILGIGFIMVAAMFPVALQQTENSTSDTTAASIAREGVSFVNQVSQMQFISANQPAGAPNQLFGVLTPTMRYTANGRNIYKLWQESNNPDNIFLSNFPMLGVPGSGSPLPSSQVIPGDVWALDFSFTQTNSPLPDDQVSAVSGPPITGSPFLLRDIVWKSAAQNMIQTGNSRFAWVAFYKRDMYESVNVAGTSSVSFAPYAQVIVVALQSRNTDSFAYTDLTPSTGSLEPSLLTGAMLIPPSSSTSSPTASVIGGIQLPGTQGGTSDRSASGAFVIIAGDSLPTNNFYHGQLNGHVFRLGNRFNDGTNNSWEFVPGFTLSASDIQTITNMGGSGSVSFNVYILGMGRDLNDATKFAGPAMDVAVYSSFIPCSN
jgi:hypothetical protein